MARLGASLPRLAAVVFLGLGLALAASGCPRNQTTLDDRTLENKPHVETERPVDRSDPFRP
jgi:hypothetical protein